ncbi:hypothetical protein [Lysobacter gummosus]|nr:hypothetical protein LG3211_2576 [Lysobacter gummosus]
MAFFRMTALPYFDVWITTCKTSSYALFMNRMNAKEGLEWRVICVPNCD